MFSEKDPPTEELIQDKEAEGFIFSYRIAFDPKRGALLIRVFSDGKLVTRFERFGIHVLSLQDRYLSDTGLHPSHRLFIQNLFRFGHLDSSEAYFVVPRKHVAFFLSRLSKFREVTSLLSGRTVPFSKEPLIPHLTLLDGNFGRLSFDLSFQKESSGESYRYDQGTVFPGAKPWILIQGIFHPIQLGEAADLLRDFNQEGRLVLTGEGAVDFLKIRLPRLMENREIILPENFQAPEVIRPKPEAVYSFTEGSQGERLILTLHFSYEGHHLPPHQDDADLLYEIPKEDRKILIRRDLAFEKGILERFYDQGFQRMGRDRLEISGEAALDFVSETLPALKEEVSLSGQEPLRHFRILGHVGKEEVRARVTSQGIDWFNLKLSFQLKDLDIPFEKIRDVVMKGNRYLSIPGQGFVKVHREEVLNLEQTLSEVLEPPSETGEIKADRFHGPYLDTLVRIDWGGEEGFAQAVRRLREDGGIPSRDLPGGLQSILRSYQHHGYDWLYFLHEHRFHGILADDMGLGKTVQALAYLQDLKNREGPKPALVLAPTSVVFNWAEEAKKFTPDLKVLRLTGSERKENYDQIETADLVLTSYAIFRRDYEFLTTLSWRVVILDEAQYIKNYRSKTAGLVKELKAEHRLALTGTPLENRLSELWSIFDFLMPDFLGSFLHFQRHYQKPIEEEQDQETLERLKKRLHPFVMRRQKEEVAPELPPKTEIDQFCEMNPEQRKIYEEILVACRRMVLKDVEEKGIEKSHFSILTALLRLRQICCHPQLLGGEFKEKNVESGKFEVFKELLEEILSEGHRVIVFSQFVEMLTLLRAWLDAEKVAYEYLDGRTRRREERIRRFQNTKEIPVFLISLKAGGTGLNLSEADYVIHYDPWWNPAVQDQATDRVHRLGQTQHVFSYKLITKESVEEKIMALQGRKRNLFKGVLTADSALGKKITLEDLEYLFS
jgi:hypothetical protein